MRKRSTQLTQHAARRAQDAGRSTHHAVHSTQHTAHRAGPGGGGWGEEARSTQHTAHATRSTQGAGRRAQHTPRSTQHTAHRAGPGGRGWQHAAQQHAGRSTPHTTIAGELQFLSRSSRTCGGASKLGGAGGPCGQPAPLAKPPTGAGRLSPPHLLRAVRSRSLSNCGWRGRRRAGAANAAAAVNGGAAAGTD